MNTLCDSFDPYFERWYAEVYRLCLVLTLHPKDAQQLLFDAALRLGAAKDPHIGEEAAKALFFESAVRLCEDYYLRRMRKAPRRESLSAALSFPLTDALWTLMHLPFKKRAALCLLHAGFTPQQAAKMAALRTAPAQDSGMAQALESICLSPEDAQAISDRVYDRFSELFFRKTKARGKEQYLVPYLMYSHPGSTLNDAIELAVYLRRNKLNPEQVQDFYPTPGTASTCMFHTGLDPFTMQPVYVPRSYEEKRRQRALLQSARPENYDIVRRALEQAGRTDLIGYGPECLIRPAKTPPQREKSAAPKALPRAKERVPGSAPRGGKATAPGRAKKGKKRQSKRTR